MCQQVQLWSVGHATVLVKDMITISCCCCCSPRSDRHQLYVIILIFAMYCYISDTQILAKDMISISCCCWSPHSAQTDRHQLYGNPVPPGRHLIATPYQDPRDWFKFGFLSCFPRQTISRYSSSKRNWIRKEKVLFWSVGHGGKKGSFWIIPLPLIAGTQKGTFFSLILSLGHDPSGQRNLCFGRAKKASFQSIHPSPISMKCMHLS